MGVGDGVGVASSRARSRRSAASRAKRRMKLLSTLYAGRGRPRGSTSAESQVGSFEPCGIQW